MSPWRDLLWVALGSALGGTSRFLIARWFTGLFGTSFAWGTLAVNISGSAVMGFAAAIILGARLSPANQSFVTHFVMIGLCGGYTTFSAFSLQNLEWLKSGQISLALWNIILSVGLCLLGTWLGFRGGLLIRA